MSKITSLEVARRAGVSQSAVSRAFTPGASVSPKTAQKVRKAAEELGYRPNGLARSLITGKSRIIGFIVSYLDNQFYPESLQKLSQALQAVGYHLLVFTIDNQPALVEKTVQELLDYQVDAIIAASVSLSTDLSQRCHEIGVPLVLYNRSQDNDHVSSVTSDNIAGGAAVAQHFLELGVKRPAYIAGWQQASTQRDREIGFVNALKANGVELFARGAGDFDLEQASRVTQEIFRRAQTPDAVFVANDHMAFGVMDALRYELGLSIPDDVKVAGYDDVTIASWPAYSLTSVRQPSNRMTEAVVNTVLTAIENPDAPPVHTVIDGPLIIRNSTVRS